MRKAVFPIAHGRHPPRCCGLPRIARQSNDLAECKRSQDPGLEFPRRSELGCGVRTRSANSPRMPHERRRNEDRSRELSTLHRWRRRAHDCARPTKRGIPAPKTGRRGTGSRLYSNIREMLRRDRCRGVKCVFCTRKLAGLQRNICSRGSDNSRRAAA